MTPLGSLRVIGLVLLAVPGLVGPVYFEPAEAAGIVTPFMVYYALHDALVKPMPGNPMTRLFGTL